MYLADEDGAVLVCRLSASLPPPSFLRNKSTHESSTSQRVISFSLGVCWEQSTYPASGFCALTQSSLNAAYSSHSLAAVYLFNQTYTSTAAIALEYMGHFFLLQCVFCSNVNNLCFSDKQIKSFSKLDYKEWPKFGECSRPNVTLWLWALLKALEVIMGIEEFPGCETCKCEVYWHFILYFQAIIV